MTKKFPTTCPSCSGEMRGQSLHCPSCQTTVSGSFALPLLLKLEAKDQAFIIDFVVNSGSLKEMAQQMKLSYPTVRNMLDDVIGKIKTIKMETDDTEAN
jgi:hypothetical protein